MKKQILNYRVIITPDEYVASKKSCYSVYCPTLDVTDYGNTVEEALSHIKEAIELRLETLSEEEKYDLPVDNTDEEIITTAKVVFPVEKTSTSICTSTT